MIRERPTIRFRFSFYKEPIGTGLWASPPGASHKAPEHQGEAHREAHSISRRALSFQKNTLGVDSGALMAILGSPAREAHSRKDLEICAKVRFALSLIFLLFFGAIQETPLGLGSERGPQRPTIFTREAHCFKTYENQEVIIFGLLLHF